MKIKPSVPKGMRDFLPTELAKRQYIIDIIEGAYKLHGYQQIATPVLENLNALTGKYGDEGDKLLFKVLNNGDYLQKANEQDLANKDSRKLTAQIADKGMRYDLTVPLARYVVQHQNDLTFPFKRYHIAPVWRADRPQKGRYREFYQCDADVIGSPSLYNEVELVQIMQHVFETLNLNVTIKYNSRKILVGMMHNFGFVENATTAITILDKLDKIGIDKVLEELVQLGMKTADVPLFKKLLETNDVSLLGSTEMIEQGREEAEYIKVQNIKDVKFDISLARGLDYYTGCVFEVVPNDFQIGSLAGGGRYDNLTDMFGKSDMTGVGISFGLDRIYDVIEGQQKFPDTITSTLDVLVVHLDNESFKHGCEVLKEVRKAGISAEIYPDLVKFPKQMKYADKRNASYVCIIGEEEIKNKKYTLKNMSDGAQSALSIEEIVSLVQSK